MPHEYKLYAEIVPLLLAFIAIFSAGYRALVTKDTATRIYFVMCIVSAVLMITAQVSWTWTYFIQNNLLGTEIANIIWTLFNSLVMTTIIYAAHKVRSR